MLHNTHVPSRRSFLGYIGAATTTLAVPNTVLAASSSHRLNLTNPHTGEAFKKTIIRDNTWVEDAFKQFGVFARDWRQKEVVDIHPNAILILLKLQKMMGTDEPMVLLSGYRSLTTNNSLPGAATNSLHLKGWAMDITQPGRSVNRLHSAAMSLKAGGVGKYTRESFVHIDCGTQRSWGS
jgi:uncharacterized protein YcbK (DUF882 family)